MNTTSAPPPPGREGSRGGKALPLQLGISAPAEVSIAEPPAVEREARSSLGPGARIAAFALATGLVVAVLVAWVLPWYVRYQCVEQAAAHGIVLTVEKASLGPDGFRLVGAKAMFTEIPGAHARVPEIDIETSGLVPSKMIARGAELFLDGPWSSVDAALARWRASARGGQSGAWAPASVTAMGSHVVWRNPFGENARLDAADVHLEVVWSGRGAELQAASNEVTLDIQGQRLGPWAVHLDRTPSGSRLRLALDPGVPDSCTILIMADAERMTALDVAVHRSPLARLGLSPAMLGLRGDDVQLEATIHYATLGPHRADATAKGALYAIHAAFSARPISVAWEAAANGDPTVGVDVTKARLAVGPLVGPLTGTLKAPEGGFRLDLAWAAGPVPCAALDTPLGPGQPFEIAYALRKVAEAASRKHLTAQVSARAELAFDSRDPFSAAAAFAPSANCERQ
ncbi:MAG: hypothetical protein M3O36_15690 [Myxococcota bacterium]|nr:hypothetical protein [Myxococcota bacterium]